MQWNVKGWLREGPSLPVAVVVAPLGYVSSGDILVSAVVRCC